MELQIETQGKVAVITIPGEQLDARNSKEFRQSVAPLLEESPYVVLDLSELRFVDSSGLGAFLSCLRQVKGRGGELRLCGMTKPVRSLFDLVRMLRVFDVYATCGEAVMSFEELG